MTKHKTFRPSRLQFDKLLGAVLCLFAVVFPVFAHQGGALAQSVHKIAVLVNNDVISERDIDQRVRLLRLTGRPASRDAAIEELVDERLKMQEAERLGISVSQEELDAQLSALAQRIGAGSVSSLRGALGQRGLNLETLTNRYRADLAWRDVLRQQFNRNVRIREQDVLAAMEERGEETEGATTTEYTLQVLTVVVPPGASSADIARRQNDAERIQAAVTSCGRVRQVASAFRDVSVNDGVTRMASQLPEELNARLAEVRVGRAASPDRTEDGFSVIVVCNKREVSGAEAASQPVETELRAEEGQLLSRRLIRDLRSDALIEYR